MPVYLLQVLNPPKTVLKLIDSIISKFSWGSSSEVKKIHWSTWKPLCLPCNEGGLGIRNLSEICDAFAIKLWIRFRADNSLWSTCMFQKYCKNSFPGTISVKQADSLTWRRMLGVQLIAEQNIF